MVVNLIILLRMKKCILILLVLLFPIEGFTQVEEFVVLTFSAKRRPHDNITWEHFWIVPFDSISTKSYYTPFKLAPFAADDSWEGRFPEEKWQSFSIATDFIWFFKTTKRHFTPPKQMIVKNRKLIQTIKKKKMSGSCEDIKIYATPIKGNIHFCRQKYLEMEYNREFYLYYAEEPFEYWPEFWDTDEAEIIARIDYSYINFDLNIQGQASQK